MTWHLPVEVSVGRELPVSYWEVVEGASPNPRCSTDVHRCGLLYCRAEMDGGCPSVCWACSHEVQVFGCCFLHPSEPLRGEIVSK